jgi:hypothetical protein
MSINNTQVDIFHSNYWVNEHAGLEEMLEFPSTTVMVMVSDIILHKGTLQLRLIHSDNSKRTMVPGGLRFLFHRPGKQNLLLETHIMTV